jgi:hypothetical protein
MFFAGRIETTNLRFTYYSLVSPARPYLLRMSALGMAGAGDTGEKNTLPTQSTGSL